MKVLAKFMLTGHRHDAYGPDAERQSHEFTFTVSVSSYGRGGDSHRMQSARALWTVLNRGFGADRVRVWANTPDKGTLRVLFIEDDDRISA